MKKLNKISKFTLFFFALFLFVINSACAKKKSILKELPQRMMWEMDSPSGTKIYVFGTAHILNEELSHLDADVIEMFRSADECYAEIASDDFEKVKSILPNLVFNNAATDKDGKFRNVSDYLTEDETEVILDVIKSSIGYYPGNNKYDLRSGMWMLCLPPWVLETMLESHCFSLYGYDSVGYDELFYKLAKDLDRKVGGLDDAEEQLKVLTYGTYEEQVSELKLAISRFKSGESEKTVNEIFEAYKNDDRKTFIKIGENDSNELPEYVSKEYVEKKGKMIMEDRNLSWAKQIKKMLKKENKTIFIFAGAAHWLGEGSVFDILIQKGILEEAK